MEAGENDRVEDRAVNIPAYYSLIGAELGFVVSIGVLAARRAMYRQEIRHSALVMEATEPMLQLAHDTPMVMPLVESVAPAAVAEPVEFHVVAEDVAPRVEVQKFNAAAGARWVEEARDAAVAIANVRDEVTSDDVWQACPPPADVDGRLLAGVFNRREWEIVGYRHSVRGRNAARQIAVWRLKQAVAA